MNKISQKVELVANIIIIIITVLLGTIVVQKYFFGFSEASIQNQTSEVSLSKIKVPGVDFSKQPKTLILALQAGCRFCTESAPFYKRLIKSSENKNIQIVAIFSSNIQESTRYLKELGISNLEIQQLTLDSLQIKGTPTLILTNDRGEITKSWTGKLSFEKEDEVIDSL